MAITASALGRMLLHPEIIARLSIGSSQNRIVLHRKMRGIRLSYRSTEAHTPRLSTQSKNAAIYDRVAGPRRVFSDHLLSLCCCVRLKNHNYGDGPHGIMLFSRGTLKLTVWGHCPSNACGWLASEFCERRLDSQECEHANQRNCVAHALTVVFA